MGGAHAPHATKSGRGGECDSGSTALGYDDASEFINPIGDMYIGLGAPRYVKPKRGAGFYVED